MLKRMLIVALLVTGFSAVSATEANAWGVRRIAPVRRIAARAVLPPYPVARYAARPVVVARPVVYARPVVRPVVVRPVVVARPVVYTAPPVVYVRPVVYAQPVLAAPAPVVVQPTTSYYGW